MARLIERWHDRSGERNRGQVLVIFALAIVVLLVMASIAIDTGRFYSEKRFLQNSADAAALAAANRLIAGGTNADAITAANEVLTRNYMNPPNGITPDLPADPPIYTSGHSGEPSYLLEGILITGSDIRVVDPQPHPVHVRADRRVPGERRLRPGPRRLEGQHAPGRRPAVRQRTGRRERLVSLHARTRTSSWTSSRRPTRPAWGRTRTTPCGSNRQPILRSTQRTPGIDSGTHGPVVTILGQGAQPSNGSDFRGFIALDIRNFATASSQIYYNEVSASTNSNTLKDMEAGWILAGGYPGPMFPAPTTPP